MISASMVKDLRDRTGAGMMDCKKALAEANGDLEVAIEHLRKSGLAKAAKRAGRAATEGRVATLVEDGVAVMVEVLCETDFAAKNEKFGNYCTSLAKRVAALSGDGDLTEQVAAAEKTNLTDLVTNIGEDLVVRRVLRWEPKGKAGSYIHAGDKLGVLVDVTGEVDEAYLKALCMHIAAFSPRFLRPEDVPAELVAKEKEIAAAQPDLQGKPENVLDKILIGKINKWYTEVCLTRQAWVHDDKKSVEKVNPKATIVRFARWQLGEEI